MTFANMGMIKSHLVMRGFVLDYTVWIHHGETMVGDDDNNNQGLDAETLKLLYQYDNEEDMFYDCGGNEQGGDLAMNKVLMMVVVPLLMAEHVRGMKTTLAIWRR
jgi:hypothetical protein